MFLNFDDHEGEVAACLNVVVIDGSETTLKKKNQTKTSSLSRAFTF